MKIFHGIEEYGRFFSGSGTEKPAVAMALGKFDGIHIGHAKLIDSMIENAGRLRLKALLFTFDKPFSSFFTGEKPEVLTTAKEREEAVREWGIDYLLEFPVKEDTVNLSAAEFIDEVLVKGINARFIAAGPDMSFGKGGKGNIEELKRLSDGRYEVLTVEKVKLNGEVVSSSLVRDKLKKGDMEYVGELLNRPYSILGKVGHGRKLGSKVLNMPTVNIVPEADKLLPPFGVYFSETVIGSEKHHSITNIGVKPTVQDEEKVNAETFLYDFNEDLYGENISVELLHFHRSEKKFEDINALKETMNKDKISGQKFFESGHGFINGG